MNLSALSDDISQIWLTIYNTFQDDENVSVEGILFKSKDIDKNSERSRKKQQQKSFDRYMLIQRYLSITLVEKY